MIDKRPTLHLVLYRPNAKIINSIFLVFLFGLFIKPEVSYTQYHNICGFVYDYSTKEPLIGATVYDSISSKGVLTDNNGYFCFPVQHDSEHLLISFIGYKKKQIKIDQSVDSILSIFLLPGLNVKEIFCLCLPSKSPMGFL